MSDKLNMTIKVDVVGKESVNFTLEYKDTDIKTVLLIEKALLAAIDGVMDGQLSVA